MIGRELYLPRSWAVAIRSSTRGRAGTITVPANTRQRQRSGFLQRQMLSQPAAPGAAEHVEPFDIRAR
jgi:hypothetical protein